MNNTLYNSREIIVIGKKLWYETINTPIYPEDTENVYLETNRAVLTFNVSDSIKTALQNQSQYIEGQDYSINYCSLTLTSSNKKRNGNLYAFMAPLDSPIDESVSWDKPTEKRDITQTNWTNGGSIEPLAKNIRVKGEWNNMDVVFNITPFINIWNSSGKNSFSIIITSDETDVETWEFYSQQANSPLLGSKPVTNAVFLGAGDTNSIDTEGVVVKISPQLPYLTVESADPSAVALNRWAAFNASVSIGDTFSMFLPDLNTNSEVYTLLDKRNSQTGDIQLLVSGSTAGFDTTKHTTGEFSCIGRVQSGSGIVEFSSPDNSLKMDLDTVLPNDTIIFDYKPTITPNNATSFTVDFYLDETLKNNRARLYLKQQTASENRSGLNTSVKKSSVRPRLSLNILV